MSARQRRLGIVIGLIAALLGLPAIATAEEPDPVVAETVTTDESSPYGEAASRGEKVEITAKRTEYETSWANPDGTTTTDINATPIRIRRGNDWVPIDLNLRQVDGRLIPGAGPTDVSFSAGGDNRLVQLEDAGEQFSLDWPDALPTPVIVGSTAEYRNVLPGVDLLMTATDGGYAQILRVNNRQAATNPRLDKLRFPTRVGAGASVVQTQGGFEVVGRDGKAAFRAPAPKMWDSVGAVGGQAAPAPTDRRSQTAREGAEVREMKLAVGSGAVEIAPDQALLDSPATVFPVFIDPQTETAGRTEWTMVQKEYPSTEFYKWANDTGYGWGEGVGHQDASGVSTKRLIWEFSLSGIPDASTITKASFRADETHSWSCTKAAVNLDRVSTIGSGTNWSNQPGKINSNGPLASSNVQVRIDNSTGGDCKKDITPITFGLDAGDYLDTAVQNSLDDNVIALRLSASETSSTGWKRFENDAVLSITHNRPPAKAEESLTDVESGRGCGSWVPSRTTFPTLSARITDPDPGELLDAVFSLERLDGAWTSVGSATVSNLASGTTFDRPMYSSWAQKNGAWFDGAYRFRAYGRDSTNVTGPWSDYCTFYLDSWDPVIYGVSATATKTDGTVEPIDFEEWTPRDRTFTFVFDGRDSNNLATSDVLKYVVTSDVAALNNKTINVSLGADGTLSFPTSDVMGEHWVTVKAYDRAGRVSAAYTQNFRVQGAVETARYEFDEGAGSALAGTGDVVPPSLNLTATGTSFGVLKPGEPENGVPAKYFLSFDGAGAATTANGVAKTNAAFSVSAWVRASDVSQRRVIISQTSSSGQVFSMGIKPCATGAGTCAFFTTGAYTVESDPVIQVGHWYVVAGSFDDMSAQRRLKVWVSDGLDPASEGGVYSVKVNDTLPSNFTPALSTGTRLASESLGGVAQSFWIGDIEDIRFYSDEVAPVDVSIHTLSDNPNKPL